MRHADATHLPLVFQKGLSVRKPHAQVPLCTAIYIVRSSCARSGLARLTRARTGHIVRAVLPDVGSGQLLHQAAYVAILQTVCFFSKCRPGHELHACAPRENLHRTQAFR